MQTAETLLGLALQCVNAGQIERAWSLCDQAQRQPPAHPGVHQLMAWLSLQQGRTGLACEHATASLALRPDHLPTWLLQVDATRAAGQLTLTARALDRVLQLDPSRTEAWFQRALLHQDAREFQAAAQALHRVVHLDPSRLDALVNWGIVLQEIGRVDEAMSAYARAYRLDENCFGRIAHALAAAPSGRMWLSLDALRAALLATTLAKSI